VSDEIKDRLHAIVAAAVALRYLLEFDSEDWQTLPIGVQNAVNDAAMGCDKLSTSVVELEAT
jgi:hypothetical protein